MGKSDFKRNKRFANLHRQLTKEERQALKESIKEEGCRHPIIVLPDDTIVDGHNRDSICVELGIDTPWERTKMSEDEAERWAIKQQLARRNLSPQDYTLLLGRLYNVSKKDSAENLKSGKNTENRPSGQNDHSEDEPETTADKLAAEHGVSEATVRRAGKTAEAFDKLTDAAQKVAIEHKLTDVQIKKLAAKSASDQSVIARELRTGQKTVAQVFQSAPKKDAEPKREKKEPTLADHVKGMLKTLETVYVRMDELQFRQTKDGGVAMKSLDDACKALARISRNGTQKLSS